MAQHLATVAWQRQQALFTDSRYSRSHTWRFDGGLQIPASASPHVVPAPYSEASAVDPEEAFVATLSSCHMLWFLALSAKRGYCVDSYVDAAIGIMEGNRAGKRSMTQVTLQPHAVFSGERQPSAAEITDLHHEAHDACFIANSVKTEIVCKPKT